VIVTPTAIAYEDDPDYPHWQGAISGFFGHDPGPAHKTLSIRDDVKIDGLVWDYIEDPDLPRDDRKIGREKLVHLWLYDFALDFSEFIDQVRRHVEAHGEVRFVFGYS
jgi:hypothetical protein